MSEKEREGTFDRYDEYYFGKWHEKARGDLTHDGVLKYWWFALLVLGPVTAVIAEAVL